MMKNASTLAHPRTLHAWQVYKPSSSFLTLRIVRFRFPSFSTIPKRKRTFWLLFMTWPSVVFQGENFFLNINAALFLGYYLAPKSPYNQLLTHHTWLPGKFKKSLNTGISSLLNESDQGHLDSCCFFTSNKF